MGINRSAAVLCWTAGLLYLTGCATTAPAPSEALRLCARPALALDSPQQELTVAVSPARKTLMFAGSTGFLVGSTVDAVVNARYRDAVREALGEFDPGAAFRARVAERLDAALEGKLETAPPPGSGAGYANEREARAAYLDSLAREGYDAYLDVDLRYGLYGTRPELVLEADAALVTLPEGRRIWSGTAFAVPRAALANDKLGEPRGKKRLDESSPQFRVDEAAFARWTADNGALLRARFDEGIEAVTAALLADLGLESSALGELYRGRQAMRDKRFSDADAHFREALRLDPTLLEARNAQAVNLAHAGQVADAIALAEQITREAPEYAPAWFNLAWWHAVDRKDPDAARPCYEEAVRLGMLSDPVIEEALAENS